MLNDHNVVREQYKSDNNLNTRISIHKKYSTNKTGFGNWIYSHYDFHYDTKILELGCGTGDMWKEKLHLLREGIQLYLTDISGEMIVSAKKLWVSIPIFHTGSRILRLLITKADFLTG